MTSRAGLEPDRTEPTHFANVTLRYANDAVVAVLRAYILRVAHDLEGRR